MSALLEPDELQVYCGEDFVINEQITIHQPAVGEIIKMGESRYWNMVFELTAIPCDLKVELAEINVDYEQLGDFELFCMLFPQLNQDDTKIILGEINPQKFERKLVENQNRYVLFDPDTGVVIDEYIAVVMQNYLCKVHGIKKVHERAMNAMTKKVMMEIALEDAKRKKRQAQKSNLKPLISTMVNSAGFKYNLHQLQQVGLCEFMDSVQRIQVIDASKALLQGCYSGNVDFKKLDKKELNYARALHE